MSIVVMNRKVTEHVQTGAGGQQLSPADSQAVKDKKEDNSYRNRIEDVEEVLPVFLKIERSPNFRFGRSNRFLVAIKKEHRDIG